MQIKQYPITTRLSDRFITKNNIKSKRLFCSLIKNAYFCILRERQNYILYFRMNNISDKDRTIFQIKKDEQHF